jgi:dUTP pyrophosphatase
MPFPFSGFRVKLLSNDSKLPTRGSERAAGYDLYSEVDTVLLPGDIMIVPLGFTAEMPYGYYGQIKDRSGMAFRGIVTFAGVMDNDYRGEWKVVLHNAGSSQFKIRKGDKICQVVLKRYGDFRVIEVDELSDTERGGDGFGSTGK